MDRDYQALVFKALVEYGPDSVFVLDNKLQIQYISRAAPGLEVEDVIGVDMLSFVPPESIDEVRRCIERVRERRQPDRFGSFYDVDENVRMRWESRVVPIIESGEVDGFIILSRDVTADAIAALERDRMFELSEDLLCVIGPDGLLRRVNPAWTKALGYPEDELLSRPFLELVHEDDREHSEETFSRSLTGELVAHGYVNRYVHKDGSVRYLQWSGACDVLSKLAFGAARDITEQRSLEERLRQSQKMEAVGQLAGGIAHDFNNLMQAVLGNVHFALAESTDPEQRSCLNDIQAAADKATQLTRQLLAFSRRQELRFETIDLNVVIRDFMRLVRRVLPERIEVDFVAGHKLGLVSGDRSQIEQVLMNLCLNARDAISTSGRITIETEHVLVNGTFAQTHPWARPGRYVLLSVTDTGEGMSQVVRERAFEPFFTTKARGQGTGLGLGLRRCGAARGDGSPVL